MEMSNQNYMRTSRNFSPLMNPYDDSESYGLQYEPLGYPQPIYNGGPVPIYYLYVQKYIPQGSYFGYMEQPLPNRNIVCNENVMAKERSSFYGARSSVKHLNDSAHYPEFDNKSLYWEGSEGSSIPCYQFNNYHTGYSHNAENFYYGENIYFGYQSPVYCGFYYPNLAYFSPSNPSPFNHEHIPHHGYPHHFYEKENIQNADFNTSLCGSHMYPVGAENSGYNYEAPHRRIHNYDTGKDPFGWGPNELHCGENTRYHNKGLPSLHDSSPQQPVCENRHDSEPINTWEVDYSSTTLESSTAKESGKSGKSHSDEATPSDTEPASPVETKNSDASTSTEVFKEKKKKSKTRRKRTKRRSNPIFHITRDSFSEEECEKVGQVCQLCEQDLSFYPEGGNHNEYYELIEEPQDFPQVSVLTCGHAFHMSCLEQVTPEEQSSDPICYLCLSNCEN